MQLNSFWQGKSNYTQPLQNIFRRYHMPPLDRISLRNNNLYAKKLSAQARVLERALAVSIPFASIEDPQTYQQTLRQTIQDKLPDFQQAIQHSFSGSKISELNQFLTTLVGEKHEKHYVNLAVNTCFEVDEPLKLVANILINANNSSFIAHQHPICVLISGGNEIGLINLRIETQGLGILVKNANQVILHNIQLSHCQRGIAIIEAAYFLELSNIFIDQPEAGILVQGQISHLWLHHSRILNGKRADNGGAGILFTDTRNKPDIEAHSCGEAFLEPLWPMETPAPHAALIEYNDFSGHVAQGIYIDGGYGIVVQNNMIANNDKEGICLDFGAVNNLLLENSFLNNGSRTRQSDESLTADLIFHYGKLADGSAVSKLPAISLDNAAQNIILWNMIRDGAGDGIKIVRTGMRNFLLFNIIFDNNRGESNQLHYSGILLGSAKLEEGIDAHQHPLDFLPSIENVVAGNIIYGAHFMGILLDKDATFNDIYDNMVRHYRRLPFARANKLHNSIMGNSWQLKRKYTTIALIGLLCFAAGYGAAKLLS